MSSLISRDSPSRYTIRCLRSVAVSTRLRLDGGQERGRSPLPVRRFGVCYHLLRHGPDRKVIRHPAWCTTPEWNTGHRQESSPGGAAVPSASESSFLCPPGRLAVENKTPAGLPSSSPLSQSDESWSIWFLSCDDTFPKRVGVPKAIAPASRKSSLLTKSTSRCISLPAFMSSRESITSFGMSSGTLRIIGRASGISLTPSATRVAIL